MLAIALSLGLDARALDLAAARGRRSEAAIAAGDGDLSARAPTDDGPPEVRALARAFNETVAKLEQLLDSQQAFVADASHQLRTPLTALRLRLENLEGDVPADALAGALTEVERLSRLVDGLLALARADAVVPSGPPVPIERGDTRTGGCVGRPRLGAKRRPSGGGRAGGARRAARVSGSTRCSTTSLANALDGLAARIGVSPCRPNAAGDWVELHVIDEGPGLSAEDARTAPSTASGGVPEGPVLGWGSPS